MSQRNLRATGFIESCLPSPAQAPPADPGWLYEIKHDGFRILALRDAAVVRLITRNGNDFTKRFPLVVAAVAALGALVTRPGSRCSLRANATIIVLRVLPRPSAVRV
jgi:hypothetical protein